MINSKEYINSGILELYAMGLTTAPEGIEVESYAAMYPEIDEELKKIISSVEAFARAEGITPDTTVKALLMATIDFTERLKNGEVPGNPPQLNERSTSSDFTAWLNNPDFQLTEHFDGLYARLINATPEMSTAIVWIKELAPQEVHHKEFEKFLILEGSCIITIDNQDHHLVAGDYLSIPLYKQHIVKVTSDIPCKAILQRIAA